MEHYFTKESTTDSNIHEFIYYINDKEIPFKTDNGVFSKKGVDFGSSLLVHTFLENVQNSKKTLLDVGCGYGVMGITINYFLEDFSTTMVDVNLRALALASENAKILQKECEIFESDTLIKVTNSYDYIICNPPIRAGKDVIYTIYEQSLKHLNDNGELYIVIQKKQGADSSKKKLTEVFGNCEIIAKKSGYQILRSVKKA